MVSLNKDCATVTTKNKMSGIFFVKIQGRRGLTTPMQISNLLIYCIFLLRTKYWCAILIRNHSIK